jgi:hypothetical protein
MIKQHQGFEGSSGFKASSGFEAELGVGRRVVPFWRLRLGKNGSAAGESASRVKPHPKARILSLRPSPLRRNPPTSLPEQAKAAFFAGGRADQVLLH